MSGIVIAPVSNGFLITITIDKEDRDGGNSEEIIQIVAESMEKCLSQVKNSLYKIRK